MRSLLFSFIFFNLSLGVAGVCTSDLVCSNKKYDLPTQFASEIPTSSVGKCVETVLNLKKLCQSSKPITVLFTDSFRGVSGFTEQSFQSNAEIVVTILQSMILNDE